jgi:hypothetical protein
MAQHRHAPDMGVGQKASASDWIRIAVKRKRVRADKVDIVPFKRFGNALLDDENGRADCAKRVAIVGPIRQSQRKFGRRAHA